jgi:GNAT superfamily N-acetyltransferase
MDPVITLGEVVERAEEQDGVKARPGGAEVACVTELSGDAATLGNAALDLFHVPGDAIDQVDVVPVVGEPGGVHPGAAAHVEDPLGTWREASTDDLAGAQQLELTKPLGDASFFVDLAIVVFDDLVGELFHGGSVGAGPSRRTRFGRCPGSGSPLSSSMYRIVVSLAHWLQPTGLWPRRAEAPSNLAVERAGAGSTRHRRLRQIGCMSEVAIRPVKDDELGTVAALRWQWLLENEGAPVTTRDEFVRHLVTWARENTASHHCLVMVRGDVVIGMAWLAVVQRVPTPRALERASGDVQCVYVVPDERDTGLGGRLIDAVLDLARELGLERATVHSSARAVSAYSRHGFAVSPRLLQADVARSSSY